MTNPDMVPAMEKAAAIVTDEGGVTSHAAIVSRELGIPCIVGTDTATEMLQDDDYVTVDATNGVVYRGKVELEGLSEEREEFEAPSAYGEPEEDTFAAEAPEAAPVGAATATKVKVNLDLPEAAERAAATKADGIGLFRLEMLIATKGVHPAQFIRTGRTSEYVNLLVEGIEKVARAFKDKPIWVRTSDLRTDEYRNLEGGDQEPHESNPMLGLHGIRRALKDPDILRAEFVAIKQLHERGYKKIGVMLPFVINVSEVREAKRIMREVGLEPQSDVDFGVMIETPACVGIIEDLCNEGIDFISFGTNDLTQLVLGIDRNNEQLQHLWDEMHPGVLEVIEKVIDVCKKHNVKTSICGQAGSRTDMAEWLVNKGISSISANIDAVQEIRNTVFAIERKILLEAARKREF
jgi:pyruvate,water dikinase